MDPDNGPNNPLLDGYSVQMVKNLGDMDYDNDDDSLPKPWLDFGPDSETVALIFQGMSDIASKWHDEL